MEGAGDVTVQRGAVRLVSRLTLFIASPCPVSYRVMSTRIDTLCRICPGKKLNSVNECLCLHAEENALLEAGRERIGEDSVIYCNT